MEGMMRSAMAGFTGNQGYLYHPVITSNRGIKGYTPGVGIYVRVSLLGYTCTAAAAVAAVAAVTMSRQPSH